MNKLGANQDRMGINEGEQMSEIKEKGEMNRAEARAVKEEQRWRRGEGG